MPIPRTIVSNVNQFTSKDTQGFISHLKLQIRYNTSELNWHSNSFNKRKYTG